MVNFFDPFFGLEYPTFSFLDSVKELFLFDDTTLRDGRGVVFPSFPLPSLDEV